MDVSRLVRKAKKGNKEALLQLIMDQKDDFYKLAYTYLGNKHDAMDALEDMILSLYENIHQLKNDKAFYSWSKSILVNSSKSLIKKRQKIVLIEDWNNQTEVKMEATSLSHPFKMSERQMDIYRLLAMLNKYQSEAIKLKYLRDLDYQSISELTNVSIGTVKSRIFEGLKKLKSLYGGDGHE